MPADIGEAEVASLEPVSQRGVINAEEIQHRGVQVMHVNHVLHRVVAQFVSVAVAETALDRTSGHPHRKALDVVIASGRSAAPLRHRRPPELAAEHDQGIFEQPAILQVLDERGGRPIHVLATRLDAGLDAAMVIPAAMVQVDEPHAAFRETPSQQAVRGVRAVPALGSVHFPNARRFGGEIYQLGNAHLHPKR